MNTTATNRKIRVLLTALKDETLVPRPEFQRRLVWTNKDKAAFIETVLLGYPFPEIYIAAGSVDEDTAEGKEMLVDGQQRMTTLNQYFLGSDDLKLPKNIRPYNNLEKSEKLAFLDYEVVVRDLGQKSIDKIRTIFERINSTRYSLNAMEIHNARFAGEFKAFAENVAQQDFFEKNRVFKTTEVRRMGDTRFALTFIITIMSAYFNRDALLEEYLRTYNDEFEQKNDINNDIEKVFSYIDKIDFNADSRAWKKADLLTLLVEVHRAMIKEKDIESSATVGRRIKEFYSKVEAMSTKTEQETNKDIYTYYKSTIQASNDRSARINRGDILKKVIHGIALQ